MSGVEFLRVQCHIFFHSSSGQTVDKQSVVQRESVAEWPERPPVTLGKIIVYQPVIKCFTDAVEGLLVKRFIWL